MNLHHAYRRLTMLGLVAVASGFVGCSLLDDKIMPKLGAEVTTGPGQVFPSAGKYIVEFRADKGKPQAVELDVTNQLHMQTALDQSGAAKKWSRMDIELYRPLPNGGWHKMEIEFDRGAHRVPPEYDYAVLPGDRIVVKEDAASLMDDFLEQALGPLGLAPPARQKKTEASKKYQIQG